MASSTYDIFDIFLYDALKNALENALKSFWTVILS